MAEKATAEKETDIPPAQNESGIEELIGKDSGVADAAIAAGHTGNPRNLDLILDIPLKVTVELGRTKMIVNDLLALGQGSVIELAKLAGEPMEVLVNDKLVARGEAVVVNEKFGVRLTDIISPMERIKQLK
jgi:flagellar motor switch protein FliN/FliY